MPKIIELQRGEASLLITEQFADQLDMLARWIRPEREVHQVVAFLPRTDNACTVCTGLPVEVRQHSRESVLPQPHVTSSTWAVTDSQLTLSYWSNDLLTTEMDFMYTDISHRAALTEPQTEPHNRPQGTIRQGIMQILPPEISSRLPYLQTFH